MCSRTFGIECEELGVDREARAMDQDIMIETVSLRNETALSYLIRAHALEK